MASETEMPGITQTGPDATELRNVAADVNAKHQSEIPRKRGRPRKNPVENNGQNPAPMAGAIPSENPAYIDPEVIRTGFTSLVRTADSYIGLKFYNVVLRATEGDTVLAEQFRAEASISPALIDAYGEAAVGLAKKYGFLLEYAPEALMLSCLVADVSIKVTTFKKIQELCHFVAKTNRASSSQAN